MLLVLWFEAGIGNDVLEQSEETKLECVVKTSADPSAVNGVSDRFCVHFTHTSVLFVAGTCS